MQNHILNGIVGFLWQTGDTEWRVMANQTNLTLGNYPPLSSALRQVVSQAADYAVSFPARAASACAQAKPLAQAHWKL